MRIRHDGTKRLWHPQVGDLELTYQSLDLPISNRTVYGLTIYTAEPAAPRKSGSSSWPAWQPPSRHTPPVSRVEARGPAQPDGCSFVRTDSLRSRPQGTIAREETHPARDEPPRRAVSGVSGLGIRMPAARSLASTSATPAAAADFLLFA
ncbi:hypothetical protein GCM10020220_104150 [Nonomuraea rubra]